MIHKGLILRGVGRKFNPSPCRGRIILSQNLFHYVTVDVGKSTLDSIVIKGEAFVVETQ